MKKTRKLLKQDQNHSKSESRASKSSSSRLKVLYQKMGDRWFAFSLVGQDVFVGSISSDEIKDFSKDR